MVLKEAGSGRCRPISPTTPKANLSASGAPREWSDDFSAVITYDTTSLFAPCYAGPSTRYTIMEVLTGDISNDHAVSGGGNLRITSRLPSQALTNWRYIAAIVGVIRFGQSCPDVSGLDFLEGTEPFTANDVCIYGGSMFTPWHLKDAPGEDSGHGFGPDGQPGVAGIDDDQDGTTDENDEWPALRDTTVNSGFGHSGANAYQAGVDAAPGAAGVDDDGNGTTDEYGEMGWPDTDDGDDTQRLVRHTLMKGNFDTSSFIYFNMDPATPGYNQCSILDVINGTGSGVPAPGDELSPGFYQPYTQYNYVYCASGTCFGAMLWTGTDMANPDESLGPAVSTIHTTADDNLVAFSANSLIEHYQRQVQVRGNSNFSRTMWVISGNPTLYYPSVSADLDGDRDVDGQDFLTFSVCYNGSLKAPQAACANTDADLDDDGDVDGQDFLTFSVCYNGSLRKPQPACFPPILTNCP